MNIEIEIIGGTDKIVRSSMKFNNEPAGELQIARDEFTRFCDLLFSKGYMVTGSAPEKKV